MQKGLDMARVRGGCTHSRVNCLLPHPQWRLLSPSSSPTTTVPCSPGPALDLRPARSFKNIVRPCFSSTSPRRACSRPRAALSYPLGTSSSLSSGWLSCSGEGKAMGQPCTQSRECTKWVAPGRQCPRGCLIGLVASHQCPAWEQRGSPPPASSEPLDTCVTGHSRESQCQLSPLNHDVTGGWHLCGEGWDPTLPGNLSPSPSPCPLLRSRCSPGGPAGPDSSAPPAASGSPLPVGRGFPRGRQYVETRPHSSGCPLPFRRARPWHPRGTGLPALALGSAFLSGDSPWLLQGWLSTAPRWVPLRTTDAVCPGGR